MHVVARLILIASFAAAACSGGSPAAPSPQTLAGTWNATRAEFVSASNSSLRVEVIAQGTTIVLTTHYMDEADELCDRVAIMHRGLVAAIGTPLELKAQVGPGATLDDVFAHHTGAGIESGGTFRDVARTRRTASRVG